MCGLTGFIDLSCQSSEERLRSSVRRMSRSLLHRGPDDHGDWVDASRGIALGFRRLAILDLSDHGHQPMVSDSGRYVLLFNGELYNYPRLRLDLIARGGDFARPFHGHSDTEVMLRAIECWGLHAALSRFVGMFAFALWDRHQHTLHLGRDRLGEKPLYYGWQGQTFLFGSELKALSAHPEFAGEIDRVALGQYLCHGYVPAPNSIYQGIHKLPPGTVLTLHQGQIGDRPTPRAYWSAREAALAGLEDPLRATESEAVDQLDELLRHAVGQQMASDVPLGAFLSGGIDSSLVVALMQAQSQRPVKTFTIGFEEERYNEAEYARGIAQHLKTDHTELYVTPAEAREVIPRLPAIYDEPFSDVSQIPTFLVAQLARRHVTVSLSGDGGDELFGGYNWYFRATKIWHRIGWVPATMRRAVAAGLTSLPVGAWDRLLAVVRPLIPGRLARQANGDRIHKFAHVMTLAKDPTSVYESLVQRWDAMAKLPIDPALTRSFLSRSPGNGISEPIHSLMLLDTLTYLPDNILAKVDRATMGVSLESRAPLLDHRVFEFAWRLPLALKVRDGQGKRALRQVLHRYVPARLFERPKMGFCVPIGEWLRGPLRGWAEDMLAESVLQRQGYVDADAARQKWHEHVSGSRNWEHHLWSLLMFQAWLQAQ